MAVASNFFKRVALYAPGAPEPIMEDHILFAAEEFCRDTWAVQEDVPAVVSTNGIVQPTAVSTLRPIGVVRLAANGQVLWSKWPNSVDLGTSNVDVSTLSSPQPLMFDVAADPLKIEMIPRPSASQSVTATIAVSVDPEIDLIPDTLLFSWAEAVAAKALERLLLMPGQSFTNPALATVFANRYAYFRSKARMEVNRGYATHGARVVGVSFTGR